MCTNDSGSKCVLKREIIVAGSDIILVEEGLWVVLEEATNNLVRMTGLTTILLENE